MKPLLSRMIFRSIAFSLLLAIHASAASLSPAARATGSKPRRAGPEIIALPDGRRMAVHHFGDPNGAPVLFFHGWPSDSSMGLLLDSAARKNHLRVIAPDRPGIGHSDPQPRRTLADWPADVRALTAHYGIRKFAVLGVSGGSPYALATVSAMPGKVTAAAVVSGVPPLDDPRDADLLPAHYRNMLQSHNSHPATLRAAFRVGRPIISHLIPDAFIHLALLRLPAPDRATLADSRNFSIIIGGMRRSWASCSDGVHDDAVIYTRPWGFPLSQIRTRVDIWHGAADANFPPELARKFAARIPGARLHIVPAEGHYSLPVNHADLILATLARSAR